MAGSRSRPISRIKGNGMCSGYVEVRDIEDGSRQIYEFVLQNKIKYQEELDLS